ncbi:MAG: ABC transporter ATP-binding protein [Deltaproteobacteria bacterium]|nr:ABC transporter ATP-binding protein [Deltaproteobacteria bacterium]MBW2071477.1 ABC transporter ATP-binding protein [Deltaproteobacteria bacterium]
MKNSSNSAILELRNITKRFGSLVAVNDVSFSLQRGKLVTFLGPSGCGKTTLLRTISGFLEPDQGEIILDGEEITSLPPNRRDTAMVFQNYALFPHMTVAQNIAFGLRVRKRPKEEIDREVERLLDLMQMAGLGSRKPHELSGGQQQRVALARALSLEPKILLLDEPLSNLDANLRISMRGEIRKLQRNLGLTIIFVTHDQEEAMSISDLLVVMNMGVVRQIGPPTNIYEHPVDEFVANFIGHVNFFPGEVIAVSGKEMSFRISQGTLKVEIPSFPVAVGDRLRAVVRPESIEIVDGDRQPGHKENVIEGVVTETMYIGSIMRVTIAAGEQTVWVDEADPQYSGMLQEGQRVKLILKKRIHMLRD